MTDKQIKTPNYSGPDRRKNLPTMDLWQENIKALNQCQVSKCQMRYALTAEELTFLMRFENEIPVGRLNFLFPAIEREMLISQGWEKFILTLGVSDEGNLSVEIRGHYKRDGVPLDTRVRFVRDLGVGVGIAEEEATFTDRRDGSEHPSSISAILDTKLKSGERKYARKDDDVKTLSVEGMVAVLCRYLKDSAVRRRVLPKSKPAPAEGGVAPPPASR